MPRASAKSYRMKGVVAEYFSVHSLPSGRGSGAELAAHGRPGKLSNVPEGPRTVGIILEASRRPRNLYRESKKNKTPNSEP